MATPKLLYLQKAVQTTTDLYQLFVDGGEYGFYAYVADIDKYRYWDSNTAIWELVPDGTTIPVPIIPTTPIPVVPIVTVQTNSTQTIDPAISTIPVLRYLKDPVEILNELYIRYEDGGEYGWYAFVFSLKTFAWWNIDTELWELLSASSDGLPTLNVDSYDAFNMQVEGTYATTGLIYGFFINELKNGILKQTIIHNGILEYRQIDVSAPVWSTPFVNVNTPTVVTKEIVGMTINSQGHLITTFSDGSNIDAGVTGAKSNYQSYLETTLDNSVKTEAEWTESLKGERGADGKDGESAPIGTVWSFKGYLADIPTLFPNWHVMDGSTVPGYGVVPDARRSFLVGADPSNSEYVCGTTGGANTVRLKGDESGTAEHFHYTFKQSSENTAFLRDDKEKTAITDGVSHWGDNNNMYAIQSSTGVADAGKSSIAVKTDAVNSHENRPQYYALFFIIKVSNVGESSSTDALKKSVYDTNNNGIVDNSEKLEGSTKAQVITLAQQGMVASEAGKTLMTLAEQSKLASINEHWRGKFTSLTALRLAIPFGRSGDIATIDEGVGQNAYEAIWDISDNDWIQGSQLSTTVDQSIIEGSINAVSGGSVFTAIAGKLAASKAAIEAYLTGKIRSHWHSFDDLEDAPVMTDYVRTDSQVATRSHALHADDETHDTIGALISSATELTELTDADQLPVMDSEDNNRMKRISFSSLKNIFLLKSIFTTHTSNHAPADAESNAIETIKLDGTPLEIAEDKSVNIVVDATSAEEPFGFALGSATDDAVAIVVPISVPYNLTVTEIHAVLGTPATIIRFTIDIKKNGTSIFSTLLSFDGGERSTRTSSIPYVLTTTPTLLAASDAITAEITQVGGEHKGKALILWITGTKTI